MQKTNLILTLILLLFSISIYAEPPQGYSNVSRDIFNYYDFYYFDFVDGTISNKAKATLLLNASLAINNLYIS